MYFAKTNKKYGGIPGLYGNYARKCTVECMDIILATLYVAPKYMYLGWIYGTGSEITGIIE